MPSIFAQHRIIGGAAVLAFLQFIASLAGLIRDRLLAQTFPGLDIVDVYIASFRPSDLMFQVAIMAGFSVALVPFLAKHKAHGNDEEMNRLLSAITACSALVFGLIALAFAIIFPLVAGYLARFEGESMKLYIDFTRIALLTNFLFVFGNAFGQHLITVQKYWIYGITPILYTAGTIFGTVYLTDIFGHYGPMYGTLIGAVIYTLVRMAGVIGAGFRPSACIWHPDIPGMIKLSLPRMVALLALQLELLIFDKAASGLDAGSVTINAYARNFQSVAVGIAGIALAQSAFSLLSQSAAKKEFNRFYLYLRKGVIVLLILTIPGSIALALLAPFAAYLVHLSSVLPVFALSLAAYSISIPFESINHLLLRSYYSLKNSVIPAVMSVINGIAAIAVAGLLVSRFGVLSLAMGFTAGQVLELIGLAVLLPRKVRSLKHET